MSLNGISRACLKGAIVALAVMMFAWFAPMAHAGAIRHAGRMLVKGTAAATAATVSGGQAAVNKIHTDAAPAANNAGSSARRVLARAGYATTNGAKDGGAAVYYAAKRTPYTVAQGARSLWRAVW